MSTTAAILVVGLGAVAVGAFFFLKPATPAQPVVIVQETKTGSSLGGILEGVGAAAEGIADLADAFGLSGGDGNGGGASVDVVMK